MHLLHRLDLQWLLRHPLQGQSRLGAQSVISRVLEQVGLGEFHQSYPAQLSGGMKMRVSIARALVSQPQVLLMDEPFGALDEIVRDRLNEEVLKLWAATGKTTLFVTHSIPEAVYLSTKIVVMSPRPGRITDVIDSPLPRERHGSARRGDAGRAQPRGLRGRLSLAH
jgi:NitT/TauT family transport system ATP-binding protein